MKREDVLGQVELAMQGNAEAFEALCAHKAGDILFVCTKLMGNTADGEDAAQEVLIRMHEGLPRLREPATFWAWMNRIVYNTCYTRLGSRKRIFSELAVFTRLPAVQEQNVDFLPEAYAERSDLRTALTACVDALPYKHKTALYMYYYEQLTVREMALALKMSEKAVYKLLGRARGALKKQLEAQPELPRTENAGMASPVLSRVLAQEAGAFAAQSVWQYTLPAVATATAAAASAAGAVAASLPAVLAQQLGTAGTALAATLAVAATATGVGITISASPDGAPPPSAQLPPAVVEEAAPRPDDSYILQESLPDEGSILAPQSVLAPRPSSAVSSSGEPVAAEAPPAPGVPQVSLAGQVAFATGAGELVPDGGRYVEGAGVRLVCGDTLLASGVVGAGGGYTLSFAPPAAGAECTLLLLPPAGFSPAGPGERIAFAYAGALPTLYITDTRAPTGAIEFEGANLERVPGAHGNPAAAVLLWADESETHITWSVERDGQLLQSGTGDYAPLTLAGEEEFAWYTLRFTLTDAAGNTTTLTREFYTVA